MSGMKLEIQVSEAEFKKVLESYITNAICEHAKTYAVREYIRVSVQDKLKEFADKLIEDELKDIDTIKAEVKAQITTQLKRRLTQMMKDIQ